MIDEEDWRGRINKEYEDFNNGCLKSVSQAVLILIIVVAAVIFFNWLMDQL